MTVRVTTLKGEAAGRYYTDHLPGYYLDGDEPPGRWWGRGADQLGLTGDVDADAFHALLAGLHPATGTRLGRRFGEGSVRGFDATFSAPKSVSVLFGVGDQNLRQAVTDAHDRAVEAVMGWVRGPCGHPAPPPRTPRRGGCRGDGGGGVPPTHLAEVGSAAAFPCGDRQPGEGTRWAVVGVGCPHHQTRSTHPLGAVSRHAAHRADPPPRVQWQPTRAWDRRDRRHRPRRAAAFLGPDPGHESPLGGEVGTVPHRVGAGTDAEGTVAAATRSRHRLAATQAEPASPRRAPPRVAGSSRGTGSRPRPTRRRRDRPPGPAGGDQSARQPG